MVTCIAVVSWGRPLLGGPVFWMLWGVWLAVTVFFLGRRAWLIHASRASTFTDADINLWTCFQVLGVASFAVSWASGFTFHR
ncbi:hypothetical protein D7X32_22280 [Corallococcus carmarthensis]|uniref:Uncharacterized protein n=2 Tax=Corallococcus carmarthensis TaxID=2316728 RepID=A0A3A8JYL1_9BACT|nr:hypothetical protein D7X32_22280 [Corallococcus carmarthensis]